MSADSVPEPGEGERPRLLDLFCGAGGSAVGYHRAGFDVVGVDIAPQPHYPFEFHQMGAMYALSVLDDFAPDAIHASPPCQAYSIAAKIHGKGDHPELVPATRKLLQATGLPWVMENVPGAPMENYVVLCGLALGCGVKRHRLFETNWMVWAPPQCPKGHEGDWVTVFGHTVIGRQHSVPDPRPGKRSQVFKHLGTDRGREAMGIDWMNRDELSQAIPPAYTTFIGTQLLQHLKVIAK